MHALADNFSSRDIETILDQIKNGLDDPAAWHALIEEATLNDQTVAKAKGLSIEELNPLYDLASSLCDKEDWKRAAPIAMQLAVHAPQESRFAFIAATCLQRQGKFDLAAGLYGLSLLTEEQPVTLFRLGECLAAIDREDQARDAFEETIEICRGGETYRHLQDWAERALVQLTAST